MTKKVDKDYQFVPGFHFKVSFIDFEGSNIEAKFQDVSGIQAELETEDIREGGVNNYVQKLPKSAKFQNLVLKRALHALPSHIVKWAENAIYNFDFSTHQIVVSLLNEENEPIKNWNFIDAYPVKIQISDLSSKENSLVIETLEMAYKHFTSVSINEFEKNDNKIVSADNRELEKPSEPLV